MREAGAAPGAATAPGAQYRAQALLVGVQDLRRLVPEAVSARRPSGEETADLASPPWPSSVSRHSLESVSQNFAASSAARPPRRRQTTRGARGPAA